MLDKVEFSKEFPPCNIGERHKAGDNACWFSYHGP